MSKTDIHENGVENERPPRPFLGQILVYAGLSIAIGSSAAGIAFTFEDGFQLLPVGIISVIIVAGIAMMVFGAKVGNFDAPSLNSKTGRAQAILLASALLGALIGFYLVITGSMDRFLEGDFTISTNEAIVALVILFVVILPMAYLRERNADDFEKTAARDAAYWAFSAYLYGYIGWSIAAAGDLAPAVNGNYMFVALLVLFLGLWSFKRSG